MSDLMERLRAPFPADRVSWRIGSTTGDKKKGMALAYIDARDVMDRLDDVCGPENWQCDYPHANGKTVCRIGIRIEGTDWVWKADGAGDTDVEAEKGALSDAFKRAAVRWGIGRYLYDLASPWVEIEARGRSFVIPEAEQRKLAKMLGGAAPPRQPAAPEQSDELDSVKACQRAIVTRFAAAPTVEAIDAEWKAAVQQMNAVGIKKDSEIYAAIVQAFKDNKSALVERETRQHKVAAE